MDEPTAEISAWFSGRLPREWTLAGEPTIVVDREEITVFRDDTKEQRIGIAREAEHSFERKVAWGVRIGEETALFTHLAVPAMTRLRQPERQVLDTLIAAGVARSRSDALAWCVRLVGRNTDEWLTELRDAIDDVERIRAAGPDR